MTAHQIGAAVPLFCGIALLFSTFAKHPFVRRLGPTFVILGFSGLASGALVVVLDDHSFRDYVGVKTATLLIHMKLFIMGIGTGAVICSLLHGHWKAAWLETRAPGGSRLPRKSL
jgi:hypothetical protein